MFKMAEALLDPKSPCAAVWTSTLHQTHSWKDEDLYGLLMIYFMTSYYDGVYPYKHDGLSRYAPLGNLELEHEDRTEDYRQTSIREREHFGWLKYGCTPPAFLVGAHARHRPALAHLPRRPRARLLRLGVVLDVAHPGGVDPTHNGINPNAICKLLWQKYKLTAAKKRTSIFG